MMVEIGSLPQVIEAARTNGFVIADEDETNGAHRVSGSTIVRMRGGKQVE